VLWSAPIEADTAQVAEARERTATLLAAHVDAETVARAQLVVSELLTNAIIHGSANEAQVVIMRAPDHIQIEVINHGQGAVHPREPSLKGQGGFGLHIVAAVSESWGADDGPPTRVWARLRG
jgi:signal transduction histidine kinase